MSNQRPSPDQRSRQATHSPTTPAGAKRPLGKGATAAFERLAAATARLTEAQTRAQRPQRLSAEDERELAARFEERHVAQHYFHQVCVDEALSDLHFANRAVAEVYDRAARPSSPAEAPALATLIRIATDAQAAARMALKQAMLEQTAALKVPSSARS